MRGKAGLASARSSPSSPRRAKTFVRSFAIVPPGTALPMPRTVWHERQGAPPRLSGVRPRKYDRPRATSRSVASVAGVNLPARLHGSAEQRVARSTSVFTSASERPRSGILTPLNSERRLRASASVSRRALGALTKLSSQERLRRLLTSFRSGPTRTPLPTVWHEAHLRAKRSSAGPCWTSPLKASAGPTTTKSSAERVRNISLRLSADSDRLHLSNEFVAFALASCHAVRKGVEDPLLLVVVGAEDFVELAVRRRECRGVGELERAGEDPEEAADLHVLGSHDRRRTVRHAGLLLKGGKEDRLLHINVPRKTAGELREPRGGLDEGAALYEPFDGGEDRLESPVVATEEVRHIPRRSPHRRGLGGRPRSGRGLLARSSHTVRPP